MDSPPALEGLFPFGSRAFVRRESVSAFQSKYIACRFLGYGYDAGKKAWRFVIEGTTKAIYSRNFKVDERPLQAAGGRMPVVNNDEYTTLQTGNHLPLQTPNETPQAPTQSYSYQNSMQDHSVSETQEDCETASAQRTDSKCSPSPQTQALTPEVMRLTGNPPHHSQSLEGEGSSHQSITGSALATLAGSMRS